jgi:hypothetical protein
MIKVLSNAANFDEPEMGKHPAANREARNSLHQLIT